MDKFEENFEKLHRLSIKGFASNEVDEIFNAGGNIFYGFSDGEITYTITLEKQKKDED